MSTTTLEEAGRKGLPLVVMVLAVALCFDGFARAWELKTRIEAHEPVAHDEAFFAHDNVLGADFPIVDWIRSELPEGTAISVDFEDTYPLEVLIRVTRLWLALLPQYPVATEGEYRVCPRVACEPGDDVVVKEGEHLKLLRRPEA